MERMLLQFIDDKNFETSDAALFKSANPSKTKTIKKKINKIYNTCNFVFESIEIIKYLSS